LGATKVDKDGVDKDSLVLDTWAHMGSGKSELSLHCKGTGGNG